jgi:hypothetical protein
MPKCYVSGCNRILICGFEERVNAHDHDNPGDTLPGKKTAWCRLHEVTGRRGTTGKRGRFLPPKDLV